MKVFTPRVFMQMTQKHESSFHRMTLREPWLREIAGEVLELRRAFHRPTNLDDHERVYIVICEASTALSVSVNNHPLGEITAGNDGKFEITELLEPRNQLVIHVPATTDTSTLPFVEAAIEIQNESNKSPC